MTHPYPTRRSSDPASTSASEATTRGERAAASSSACARDNRAGSGPARTAWPAEEGGPTCSVAADWAAAGAEFAPATNATRLAATTMDFMKKRLLTFPGRSAREGHAQT